MKTEPNEPNLERADRWHRILETTLTWTMWLAGFLLLAVAWLIFGGALR